MNVSVFAGETKTRIYQALVVKKGIQFYAKHKMPINKLYTPKNMRRVAEQLTGKKFKARAYGDMVIALEAYIASAA